MLLCLLECTMVGVGVGAGLGLWHIEAGEAAVWVKHEGIIMNEDRYIKSLTNALLDE